MNPHDARAHNNLGVACKGQGKLDEAVAAYRRALELQLDFADAHYNLGRALQDQGQADQAAACYRRALQLKPDYAEAYNNLGNVWNEQGKLDQAIACYHRALQLKPDFAQAHNNLGNALKGQGKPDQALAHYQRALQLQPDFAEACNNLGAAFRELGKLAEAVASYRQALQLKPDYAEAHANLATAWLLAGDWRQGWPEYQWRWRTKDCTPRHFPQPVWDGATLAGKTILLYAEQGLGDTIQFVRYAPLVKQFGGTVVLECQPPLRGLLEGSPGIDRLIGRGDDLPPFDVHASLLSLPGILQTTLQTIPAKIPYLSSRAPLVQQWRNRLHELDGFKIGISWQGNPNFGGDRLRSIPLRCFAPLAGIAGVRLLSLQKAAGSEQVAEVRDLFPVLDLAGELDRQTGPFLDTAAVMQNLDLVIASDSAAVHLAGALGVPVWVALPLAPDWRWLLDRDDSPWYPTMRSFGSAGRAIGPRSSRTSPQRCAVKCRPRTQPMPQIPNPKSQIPNPKS